MDEAVQATENESACNGLQGSSSSSSEDEADEDCYRGYQILSGNAEDICEDDDETHHYDGPINKTGTCDARDDQTPSDMKEQPNALFEVSFPPPPLTQDKASAIKQAMSGFSLPKSATPQWAKDISEESWKKELLDGLKSGKRSKKKPPKSS